MTGARKPSAQDIEDFDVMLLRDGEIDAGEKETVENAIAANPELAAKVAGLNELGELVRGAIELDTDDAAVDGEQLWSRIERRIAANGEAKSPEAVETPEPRPGLAARLATWFESYRAHLVTGVVCAAAASLLVLAMRDQTGDTTANESGIERPPVTRPESRARPPVALTSEPIEVESLEVYQGSGTILNLPAQDGEASTSVIWLSNEDSEETMEGPI